MSDNEDNNNENSWGVWGYMLMWSPKEKESKEGESPFSSGQLLRSKKNLQYKLEGSNEEELISVGENFLPSGSLVMFVDYTKQTMQMQSVQYDEYEMSKDPTVQAVTGSSKESWDSHHYKLRLLYNEQTITLSGINPHEIAEFFEPCSKDE